jgi:hypothetical protein
VDIAGPDDTHTAMLRVQHPGGSSAGRLVFPLVLCSCAYTAVVAQQITRGWCTTHRKRSAIANTSLHWRANSNFGAAVLCWECSNA